MPSRAVSHAVLGLALGACGQVRPQRPPAWPSAVALTPVERSAPGCYRVHGVTRSDSAETGFAADSILRLDDTIRGVVVPAQGRDVREYVNEHPFRPRPENYETVWWVGHDGALHLEWRTPRQSGRVWIYGGGKAELRVAGDSLVGETTAFRDVGGNKQLPIVLTRLPQCPQDVASIARANYRALSFIR